MKKIISLVLAALIAMSVFAVTAFAEDDGFNEKYGLGTADYRLVPDPDFCTAKTTKAGNPFVDANGKATLLQPGDTIAVYTGKSGGITVKYYPDADVLKTEGWKPSNAEAIAFSKTTKNYVEESVTSLNFQAANKVYTILPLEGDIDYTLNLDAVDAAAKESGKIFLGWVIDSYTTGTGSGESLNLYAVWAKNPDYKAPKAEEPEPFVSPLEYIVNYYMTKLDNFVFAIAEFFRARVNLIVDFINDFLAGSAAK